MGRTIDLDAAIDELKNMYQSAEKWGQKAKTDVVKARAESCMASLVEMKLRIAKLPLSQPEITDEQAIDHLQKSQVCHAANMLSSGSEGGRRRRRRRAGGRRARKERNRNDV